MDYFLSSLLKDSAMFYKLNKYTFVRNINNYLVIVDKRTENELIGDYTSYLFVRHLKHEAQDKLSPLSRHFV